MKVRFAAPSPAASAAGIPAVDDVAAWFDGPDARYEVRFGDLCGYQDLNIRFLPPQLRRRAVVAVCQHVRQAPLLAADERGALDLAARFDVVPDRDTHPWRVRGFRHLDTLDVQLVRHVLAVGLPQADDVRAWWRTALDHDFDHPRLLAALDATGARDWRSVDSQRRPFAVVRLYSGLPPAIRVAGLEALTELRERFAERVRTAIQQAGSFGAACHAHLGEPGDAGELHFMDQRGLYAVAEGPPGHMRLTEAKCINEPGDDVPSPVARGSAFGRLVSRIVDSGGTHAIHTPEAWQGSIAGGLAP